MHPEIKAYLAERQKKAALRQWAKRTPAERAQIMRKVAAGRKPKQKQT